MSAPIPDSELDEMEADAAERLADDPDDAYANDVSRLVPALREANRLLDSVPRPICRTDHSVIYPCPKCAWNAAWRQHMESRRG